MVRNCGHVFWKVEMRIRLEFGDNIIRICTQIRKNPLRIRTEFTPRLKRIRSGFLASFGHFHSSDFGPNTY